MVRKLITVSVGAMAIVALVATLALADQTNGTGKTFLGFSLGFNAQSDLSGNMDYHFTDVNGNDVDMHCNDYSRYVQTTTTNGKYPRSIVNSVTCINKATNEALTLHAEFVDKGEGAQAPQDKACLTVKDSGGNVLIHDCGPIQNGNIQIHTNADPVDPNSTYMLSTTP